MEKLTNKEAVCLVLTIIASNIVLVSSQIITRTCSSASLINSLYISLIILFLMWIISILYKNFHGLDILDISEFLGGKFLKTIVGILFMFYSLTAISVSLRKIADCLQIIYYPLTNIVYIVLLFLLATGITCKFRVSSISRANYIILPIILSSVVLVFIGNTKNFNFENIFPILGYGTKETFLDGLGNMFVFSGMIYLYFISPMLKNPDKFKKISLLSITISAIFLLFAVSCIIFMFNTTISSSELFPLYTSVRYIEFGSFFQRLDATFLLIWTISFLSSLCIVVKLCSYILTKISNISNDQPTIYPILLCIFSISILIKTNSFLEYTQNIIFKILFFAIVLGLALLILVSANIKKKIYSKGSKNV